MIPRKFGPALFALILSGQMSLLVSGIAVYRAAGPARNFTELWMHSWLIAWALACPVVLVAAPLARRAAGWMVAKD